MNTDVPIVVTRSLPTRYDDSLLQAGRVADHLSQEDVFAVYHAQQADNTHLAQRDALFCFSRYLAEAHVARSADDLFTDAEAWRGLSHGVLKGFRTWLVNQGYRIGTLNQRLAIVRQYCTLAHEAGVLDQEAYDVLMTVKGYSGKTGRHLDAERTRQGTPTQRSTKKATPAPVSTAQAMRLKTETTAPTRARRTREQGGRQEAQDALMMGLFVEHALRVSEVVGMNIEQIDLERGTFTLYRSKGDVTETHRFKRHTLLAAETYLMRCGRTSGPLFLGYKGQRITRFGLYDRVKLLGQQVGIPNLSPHDLRHFWTVDALANGTTIDRVQSAGSWKSPTMVLGYARRTGIANEGVKITE